MSRRTSTSRLSLGAAVAAALALTGTAAVAVQADGAGAARASEAAPTGVAAGAAAASTRTEPSADVLAAARRAESRALRGSGLRTPAGWGIADVRTERHDGRAVTVIRRQPDGYRLGGPHATVVADDKGTLLGFTSLAEQPAGAELPGAGRSEWTALRFLRHLAPGHVDGLNVAWVDPHRENITRSDGSKATVSGTKVKMHHDNGLYTWVVIAPNGEVLTYERDIVRDLDHGCRGTQMWLHDSWIAAHDGAGPQSQAPYAPVRR